MKKLLSLLIAAVFTISSGVALAQGTGEKKEEMKKEQPKKTTKKKATKKSSKKAAPKKEEMKK